MTATTALGTRAAEVLSRLPPGTVELAASTLRRGLAAAGSHVGDDRAVAERAERLVLLPVLLDPDWPEPLTPLPVGDGAVHADLTDDDAEAFARLRAHLDAETVTRPEGLAAAAQEWRLPVTPYRRPGDGPTAATTAALSSEPGRSGSTGAAPTGARYRDRSLASGRSGDGPVVVDLTALWAGPLATHLLAEAGATVVKVDPSVRPDALVEHQAVYEALNRGKEIIDLDLRLDADRTRFEELVARADLLIDSFSRRVLPNLGYDRATLASRFPDLATLSITAFAPGSPEIDWVAYGPGVHAIMGLGHLHPDGRPRPAPIAYPDALAGLVAFTAAAEMLVGGASGQRIEVSLAAAIAPLVPGRQDAPRSEVGS